MARSVILRIPTHTVCGPGGASDFRLLYPPSCVSRDINSDSVGVSWGICVLVTTRQTDIHSQSSNAASHGSEGHSRLLIGILISGSLSREPPVSQRFWEWCAKLGAVGGWRNTKGTSMSAKYVLIPQPGRSVPVATRVRDDYPGSGTIRSSPGTCRCRRRSLLVVAR